ncbi:hypothetical protein ACFL59_06350 [Planctomycetota bacterium]
MAAAGSRRRGASLTALVVLFSMACGGGGGDRRLAVGGTAAAVGAGSSGSVTLTAPTGAELWSGSQDVTWTTAAAQLGTVTILLSADSGLTYPKVLASAIPDTGRFPVDTTTLLDGTRYRIRISAADALGALLGLDASGTDFTIRNTTVDVTAPVTVLTGPVGGERWVGTEDITWSTTDANPATVDIWLSADSGRTFPALIASAAPDSGRFALDTTAFADGATYRVRVVATDAYGNVGAPAESAGDFAIDNVGALYAVNFSAPTHTVGGRPTTGAGAAPRATISSIQFGTPTILGTFNGRRDQALELNSFDGAGDQILLDLRSLPAKQRYTVSASVVVSSSQNLFRIHLDTPQIRNLTFYSNGNISQYVPGHSQTTIATYSLGTKVDVRVEVDLSADTWEIFVNNASKHRGGFGGAAAINAIRFSTPVTPSPPGVNAVVDDIFVSGR